MATIPTWVYIPGTSPSHHTQGGSLLSRIPLFQRPAVKRVLVASRNPLSSLNVLKSGTYSGSTVSTNSETGDREAVGCRYSLQGVDGRHIQGGTYPGIPKGVLLARYTIGCTASPVYHRVYNRGV